MLTQAADQNVDRWVDEQMFEEDVRAVLKMMRPNRRERLQGWDEYRTGGPQFRVTISWDPEFGSDDTLKVPNISEVLENILIGTIKCDEELTAAQEFEIYRSVVRDLYRRVDEMQACYE